MSILEGKVSFTRELEIKPSAESRKLSLNIRYQACTDTMCQPPSSFKTFVSIPATMLASPLFENKFAAPERLMVDGLPLNSEVGQKYPSPALYDVDQDGQVELVVGDIFGSLRVYENKQDDPKGDPIWAKPTALNTADGKPIKVSNW